MDAAFFHSIGGDDIVARPRERLGMNPKRLSESEFEKEVDACLPQLIAVARRLSADDEMAGDAVQQALLRASKAWRRFRGGSQVSTWLTRIVIRETRRLMKTSANRRSQTNSVSDWNSLASDVSAAAHDGPQRQLQQKELGQLIRAAASELPDRQREVFTLIVWQEMPVDKVADLLQIKPQNVYANLHAARETLRRKLNQYLGAEENGQ